MSDLIDVVVLDYDGNKIRRSDGTWETIQIDRSQLGEEFQEASDENIAVQQLVNQPGSFAVVLCDDLDPDSASWSRASVLALIECYKRNKGRFKAGRDKKKLIWQDIVNTIQEETGQLFTCLQAQTKWKKLTGSFREVLEHNSSDDSAKRTCNYFTELLEVYRYKPNKIQKEELESLGAEDGSAESGDDIVASNGSSAMEEGNSPAGNQPSSGSTFKWSQESVLVLLKCYKNNEARFKSSEHKKKHIWQEIADVIYHEVGQQFSWTQAEAKWKNLTKRYRDVLEHNATPGNSVKTCSFFAELHELHKLKPVVKSEETEACYADDGSAESGNELLETNGASSPMDEGSTTCNLSSGRSRFKWNRESVLVLIECYENNKARFRSSLHKKKHIWQDIARVIHDETGQHFTWFQVEAKWKNLTKKFRDVVDHNSVARNTRRTCSYFSEIHKVYGYKPSVKSFASASSGSVSANNGSAESNDENPSEEPTTSTQSSFSSEQKCQQSSNSTQDDILRMLHKMHEENKAVTAEQMAIQKAMHEEKLAVLHQIIDILKAATENKNG